jgi:SSS family solute:Na+ symporter
MHINSQEGYFLADRKFGKIVQTFASFGMATSVDNAVGLTVIVARNGIAGIWQSLIQVFSLPIFWITSVWYRRLRLLTLGDFFEERYNSKSMAAFYAIVSSFFFIIVIALGFKAMTSTIAAMTPKPVSEFSIQQKTEYAKAIELETLENSNYPDLNEQQQQRLQQLRLEKPQKRFSYINETAILWVVAIVTVVYAVAGGLEAAFLVDLLQGLFLLIMAVLLLPFAGAKILHVFGGQGMTGIIDVTRSQLSGEYFKIWGSSATVDFTWYYIIVLFIMSQVNVAVQANQFIACGSARDEYTARWGFTVGIYMKRFATLLWGVTAMLLIVLYKDLLRSPDYLWGHACHDLLGGLNIGLVGLMIACLMAALMSTVSALMITSSGLLTHNVLRKCFPERTEKFYVQIGRILGIWIVLSGALIATRFVSIIDMLKILWEFNIVLAASFWLGMKWRRANKAGAWSSMIVILVLFGLLPTLIPLIPCIRGNAYLLKTVEPITVRTTYIAHLVDVDERQKIIGKYNSLPESDRMGKECPRPLEIGQRFEKLIVTPKESIFWTEGIRACDDGRLIGSGRLNLELVFIDVIGIDLSKNSYAFNESIRMSIRTVLPFVVLIIVSLLTHPEEKQRLDKFYVKMKTPIYGNKNEQAAELAKSYDDPTRFDYKKMFRNSNWEFEKFDSTDLKGIVVSLIGGIVILMLLFVVASVRH